MPLRDAGEVHRERVRTQIGAVDQRISEARAILREMNWRDTGLTHTDIKLREALLWLRAVRVTDPDAGDKEATL